MKKIMLASVVLVLAVILMISCSKTNPAAPEEPTGTATLTSTITPTYTDTPVFTSTATPTVTVTSTSTPADLYVDDFEDGDYNNAISSWGANTLVGSLVHYYGLITPPPGNGSHSFAVTATVNVQTGNTLAYVNTSTGPTGSATAMNASMYNKLRFGRMFNGALYSGSKSIYISIYDDLNIAQYQIISVFSTAFEEAEINLRSGYSLTGGTIDALLSNIKQINVSVYVQGVPGDNMIFNLVIDDMRFTHN